MKFGSNLPRNQVPEWAAHYINYKGLKKLIKFLSNGNEENDTVDTAGNDRTTMLCISLLTTD